MPTTVTRTVAASGGDHTSLQAAWDFFKLNHPDFVADDIVGVIECEGFEDTTAATIDNAVNVDAEHFLTIRPAGFGDEALLPFNETGYRLRAGGTVLTVEQPFTRIERIQIFVDEVGGGGVGLAYGANQLQFSGILITGQDNANIRRGFSKRGPHDQSWNVFFRNCVVYGLGSQPQAFDVANGSNIYYYNCTAIGSGGFGWSVDIDFSTEILTTNCLAQGFDVDFSPNIDAGDFNISQDATAPGANSQTNTTVSFADAGQQDYHLDPSDPFARDMGTDPSADITYVWNDSIDFDGETRVATWDIGADEVVIGTVLPTVTVTISPRQISVAGGGGPVVEVPVAEFEIRAGGQISGFAELPAATVTLSAEALTPVGGEFGDILPVASVEFQAQALTPLVNIALPVATVQILSQPLTPVGPELQVVLPVAELELQAQSLSAGRALLLPTAQVELLPQLLTLIVEIPVQVGWQDDTFADTAARNISRFIEMGPFVNGTSVDFHIVVASGAPWIVTSIDPRIIRTREEDEPA